jgi:hypothetical protein
MASLMGSTTLEGFAAGSSELAAEDRSSVKFTAYNISTLLKQYPLSTVRVTGYADGAATTLEAGALAQGRANAVQAALIEAGVPAAMIAAQGSSEASPGGKGRVEVRFEPKRLFRTSLLPMPNIGPRPSFAIPGVPGVTPGLGAPGLGMPGLGPAGMMSPGPGAPRIPSPQQLPWLQPGPLPLPQTGASALPSLDLKIGGLTISLPTELKAKMKLPSPLAIAKNVVFELSYDAPAKVGLKIVLDGTPHVTVGVKGGIEHDPVKGKTSGSAGLIIESANKICHADDSEALRLKIESTGEKLNKSVEEYGKAKTEEEKTLKAMDIADAIGEIYRAVQKYGAGCSETPRWTLEFGYKGVIDKGKSSNQPITPNMPPIPPYVGFTFTWRFGEVKQ